MYSMNGARKKRFFPCPDANPFSWCQIVPKTRKKSGAWEDAGKAIKEGEVALPYRQGNVPGDVYAYVRRRSAQEIGESFRRTWESRVFCHEGLTNY